MSIYSIYKITNLSNHKVYVGWTSRDPQLRFEEHQKRNKAYISHAIKKYGVDNFCFEVIYQSLDYEHSRAMETHFIAECNSLVEQHGYNQDAGGTGHKRTEATIEKHREKIKGRKQSAEHIAKRKVQGDRNAMFGKTGEKHHRYGAVHSEETKAKIRAAKALKSRMSDEERRLARCEYSRRQRDKNKQT